MRISDWSSDVCSSDLPEHKRYLLLKSRIHYRAGFAPLAKATFTLDGEGATTSDNSILTYEKLRRPIYPLDRINDWNACPGCAPDAAKMLTDRWGPPEIGRATLRDRGGQTVLIR